MGKRKSITGIKRRPKSQKTASIPALGAVVPHDHSSSLAPEGPPATTKAPAQLQKAVRKKRKSITGIKRRPNQRTAKSAAIHSGDLSLSPSSSIADIPQSSALPHRAIKKKRKSITGVKKRPRSQHVPSARTTPALSPTSSEVADSETTSANTPSTIAGRRKHARSVAEEDSDEDEQPRKKLAYFKPRTTYVKLKVINDKWQPLPVTLLNRLIALLKLAKRPVISRFSVDLGTALNRLTTKQLERIIAKEKEVQLALEKVDESLRKNLAEAKFPPDTKAMNFDYESILDSNRSLEQQLDPTLHATALLEAEIRKEERILNAEKAELATLKKNAKAAEVERRRIQTQMPISIKRDIEIEDKPDRIGLVTKSSNSQPFAQLYSDASIQPLVAQLQSHLDSMISNASGVAGIGDSLLRAKAVVNELLQFT
ncbi:MAG: hypothetical protein MMC33_002229 [Icmadophila ericetorum]|nr:hypothetical protein [Icmadophila ericetorum]